MGTGGDGWKTVVAADATKLSGATNGITLADSDHFGSAVALEDSVLAVGAADKDTGGLGRGAAYLIASGRDDWGSVETGDVVTVDSGIPGLALADGDAFGSGLALYDGLLTVGVPKDDTGGTGASANRGAVVMFDPAFTMSLLTGDFEKDSTPTGGDSKLAEGTATVTATPTDFAGNSGTAVTGTFVYDQDRADHFVGVLSGFGD